MDCTKGYVSFGFGNDEMVKEGATIADLIMVLNTFPPDMRVNACLECIVDSTGEVVMLEDSRVTALLEIILDCPFCKECVSTVTVDNQQLN